MSPDHSSTSREATLMRSATYAAVATAVFLIGAKAYAWWLTGSVSLLASLVDSLMDAAASLLNLFAVRYALTPADEEHRFGHGKAESLAALTQAGFILVSCAFLIHEAGHRLLTPAELPALEVGMGVMGVSIVVTAMLVMFQGYVVKRTNSAAIRADAVHYRADLLANIATLTALGLASIGLVGADPIFGLAIAVWLLISTREILRDALNQLLDRELPEPQRTRIIALARENPAVMGVHDVRTRMSGRTPIVQMHIELDAQQSLVQAHSVADAVEQAILGEFPGADIVIHQDPAGIDEQRRWPESDQ